MPSLAMRHPTVLNHARSAFRSPQDPKGSDRKSDTLQRQVHARAGQASIFHGRTHININPSSLSCFLSSCTRVVGLTCGFAPGDQPTGQPAGHMLTFPKHVNTKMLACITAFNTQDILSDLLTCRACQDQVAEDFHVLTRYIYTLA